MCRHYDPSETSKQCSEDDAEKVQDKQAANFCDYFALGASTFDAAAFDADAKARAQLSDLFGDGKSTHGNDRAGEADELLKDAEALFKK